MRTNEKFLFEHSIIFLHVHINLYRTTKYGVAKLQLKLQSRAVSCAATANLGQLQFASWNRKWLFQIAQKVWQMVLQPPATSDERMYRF